MKPHEQLWIDYLEGELDSEERGDLELLASHSRDELKFFEEVQRVRRAVKWSDRVEMPSDKAYFDRLSTKIMAGVQIHPVQTHFVAKYFRLRTVSSLAASVAVIAMVGVLAMNVSEYLSSYRSKVVLVNTDPFISVSLQDPGMAADILALRGDESDFLLETAISKLDGLSEKEARKIVDQLVEL